MDRMSGGQVAQAFERLGPRAREEDRDRLKFRYLGDLNPEPERASRVFSPPPGRDSRTTAH